MKSNSKREERNVEKFSPKTGKKIIASSMLQLANFATFCMSASQFGHAYVGSLAPARACSALHAQRACELKLSPSAAELVSEFRKYSQGGERIGPKFATLRAKCGEIQSEKFGRFVSERTVTNEGGEEEIAASFVCMPIAKRMTLQARVQKEEPTDQEGKRSKRKWGEGRRNARVRCKRLGGEGGGHGSPWRSVDVRGEHFLLCQL
jgi:hypothetical protein